METFPMRVRSLAATCLLLLAPLAASAQAGPGVSATHASWKSMTTYIAQAAAQMPESSFSYRPTAGVRTFGQLVGHVAGAQKMLCAAALGEPAGSEDEFEKGTMTKAALVQAMKTTTAYCERAYAQSDQAAAAMTTVFGEKQTRISALALNATHNGEHYGNIVTYLRMQGMVPPSSQPSR
jgi:uncharacterized damage-inducible protein DinB